jgi:hypothetical protein
MILIETPQDKRCGHNFEPANCPYSKCALKDALARLATVEEERDAAREVKVWREKAGLLDWIAENIDSLQVVRRRKPNHDTWTVSYPFPATGCITDIDGTELLAALRAAKEKP